VLKKVNFQWSHQSTGTVRPTWGRQNYKREGVILIRGFRKKRLLDSSPEKTIRKPNDHVKDKKETVSRHQRGEHTIHWGRHPQVGSLEKA